MSVNADIQNASKKKRLFAPANIQSANIFDDEPAGPTIKASNDELKALKQESIPDPTPVAVEAQD